MKVAINWLKELVEIEKPIEEVAQILTDKTVSVKSLTDKTLELDMKGYNRADLFSLRGVASEIAAITGSKIRFEEPKVHEFDWMGAKFPGAEVLVKDEKRCPVYCIVKIDGLKVSKSPQEWVKKLEESGLRSVNNVADITNLIMLEYGQPMHAFDAKNVTEEAVIVRTAKLGEKIETLDGKIRPLEQSDLLIADPEKAIGIAGVMGGKNSEVTVKTTKILLEAAIFDPANTRKTSTRLGLQSEASKRFYHGLTKKRLFQALDAAVKMYEEIGGKVTALTIEGDPKDEQKRVNLTLDKTNSLIGINFKNTQIEDYLKALNFKMDSGSQVARNDKGGKGEVSWVVTPPYYRLDIEFEEDLIEEVARMYGYKRIPSIKLNPLENKQVEQSMFGLLERLKHELADLGLTEVQTYSFYSFRVLENLGWRERDNLNHLVKIQNPISSETEYMRMTVWPNLVEVAAKNIKNGIKDIAIFEIGKMYSYDQAGEVMEGYELAVIISGQKGDSLAGIYGIYKKIALILGLEEELEPSGAPSVVRHLFHPNKFLPIKRGGEQVGGMAEVHPRIVNKFGIDQRMAVIGLHLTGAIPSYSATVTPIELENN